MGAQLGTTTLVQRRPRHMVMETENLSPFSTTPTENAQLRRRTRFGLYNILKMPPLKPVRSGLMKQTDWFRLAYKVTIGSGRWRLYLSKKGLNFKVFSN